jgi:hypothetical protein
MIALVAIVWSNGPHDAPDHFADPGNKTASDLGNSDQRVVDRVGLSDGL